MAKQGEGFDRYGFCAQCERNWTSTISSASRRQTPPSSPSLAIGRTPYGPSENETGTVNIIAWPQVAEEKRTVLLEAKLRSVERTHPAE